MNSLDRNSGRLRSLAMKLPINFIISLIFFIPISVSYYTTEICPYERTVKVIRSENGSYMYRDLEIPEHLVQMYNYTIENKTRVSVEEHPRGCICGVTRCLRVCSNGLVDLYQKLLKQVGIDYDYNTRNNTIDFTKTADIDFGFSKRVILDNGTETDYHIVHDYHHVVGLVCDSMYLLDVEQKNMLWTLFENGTLLRHEDRVLLSEDEYCFDAEMFEVEDNGIIEHFYLVNPFNCNQNELYWTWYLNAYAMIFSIPGFVITIILYCILPYLRNVHGKCFISYLSALAMSYSLIIYVILQNDKFPEMDCIVLGYLIYYTMSAYLTWTCIISFDCWITIQNKDIKVSFKKYSIVGWLVPLLMTILTFLAQTFCTNENLKPGIDQEKCGLKTDRWSASIYLYIPCILVLIFSSVLYISVLRSMEGNHQTVKKYCRKSQMKKYWCYLRLFIFMGVSWIFDILSYFLKMAYENETPLFITITNLLYASQGGFICVIFIIDQWSKIRERLCGRRTREHRRMTQITAVEFYDN